ncbi:MAG TPA: helix-turn-helix domain-containing protein [Syntrophomonadaceae bacterium]|nr:helix-turn-helix domain-containing protein [Syntrophomonadaceae bacterium]
MLEQFLKEQMQEQMNAKVGKSLFQRILNSFSHATKINSAVTDVEGKCILTSQQGDCEFCQLVKSSSSGLARCRRSYAQGGIHAIKWKEPYFFKCHAGLISWVCPISYRGKHIGNLVCGQVRMWQPTELNCSWINNFAERNGLDAEELMQSFNKVKQMSTVDIQAAADLALIITSYMDLSGADIFDFHRKLRKVGSWIWGENKKKKDVDSRIDLFDPEQDMSNLASRIFAETRNCNIAEAKKLLEQLVLQMFIQSKGQLEIMKGRSLEFLSLFTRLSTEYGVKFGEVIHLSDLKLKEIDDADTVDKAVLWLLSVGNVFIDVIAEKNTSGEKGIVSTVIDYIQNNYSSKSLSVQEIAGVCHMNPAYLGQLFKKRMGYSIIDYIHDVRIEQAKRLLVETDQNIDLIADQAGFKDRSYFCKIFKKKTGLSPGEYKKENMLSLA